MKFWTWRTVLNLVGMACAAYLVVLGFSGKMPSIYGAVGWLLVSFNMFCDLMSRAIEHQMEKNKAEAMELLRAFERIQREMRSEQCSCSDDCCGRKEE